MTRHAKPLDSQLNLLLVDAPKTVIPDSKQRELSLALVELREFSGEVRTSEAVALSDPVMPVFDGLCG